MDRQQGMDWSRRGFLKGALLGGAGAAVAGSLSPEAMARALLQGKTAADIKGAGVEPGIVDLDQNENPLGPSPMAIEAIKSRMHELNRYMNDFPVDMYMKLNMMAGVSFEGLNMARPTRADMQEAQKRNRIQIATGSTAILRSLSMSRLSDGGHAVEAEGGYGDITRIARALQRNGKNVTLTRVPLTADKKHDLKAMQKAVNSETKIVVVTNPNNPTGTLSSYEDIGWFIDNVPENVLVIVDEAYIDFVKDSNYKHAAAYAISRPNVVVSRTFSKVYGLPGVRMGYAIGHPQNFNDFWLYAGWMMPTLSVYAAAAAVNDTEHIQKSKEAIWAGREYLEGQLTDMGIPYTPSASNFMVLDMGKDPGEIINYLRKNKVLVRNAHDMWDIKNHFRVSIGTMDELEVFVNTLKDALVKV